MPSTRIAETLKLTDKEKLANFLKEHVAIRDKMSGAMWWNILNDECCEIANRCVEVGCDKTEIGKILGEGTFR